MLKRGISLVCVMGLTGCGGLDNNEILNELNDNHAESLDTYIEFVAIAIASDIPNLGKMENVLSNPIGSDANNYLLSYSSCDDLLNDKEGEALLMRSSIFTHKNHNTGYKRQNGNYRMSDSENRCLLEFSDTSRVLFGKFFRNYGGPSKDTIRHIGFERDTRVEPSHGNFVVVAARHKFTKIEQVVEFGGAGCQKLATVTYEPHDTVFGQQDILPSGSANVCLSETSDGTWIVSSVTLAN